MSGSRIPGFYKLGLAERAAALRDRFGLDEDALALLRDGGSLTVERADKMVENCIGVIGLPVGLGLNFRINGRDYVVPMAVEEPSVIAAVSNMAQLVRRAGGFEAAAEPPIMMGQIQVLDVPDPDQAVAALEAATERLLARANALHPNLAAYGGGAREIEVRRFDAPFPMLVVHVFVHCADAMGANAVNAIAEGLAPLVEALTGGRVHLRILSNLADRRRATATCTVPEPLLAIGDFDGATVAEGIVQAWRFAAVCPYRAATHNKGVMNGVDAVAVAMGQDWRSIEAGAHAYAARGGRYGSLTEWSRADGCLCGRIELPMAVGTVGGSTEVHPTIGVLRRLLGVRSTAELAMVMATVGLAQNMGALRALATEGIQRGHMTLHARSVALAAGAEGALVDALAARLVESGRIKLDAARGYLEALRRGESPAGLPARGEDE